MARFKSSRLTLGSESIAGNGSFNYTFATGTQRYRLNRIYARVVCDATVANRYLYVHIINKEQQTVEFLCTAGIQASESAVLTAYPGANENVEDGSGGDSLGSLAGGVFTRPISQNPIEPGQRIYIAMRNGVAGDTICLRIELEPLKD